MNCIKTWILKSRRSIFKIALFEMWNYLISATLLSFIIKIPREFEILHVFVPASLQAMI